MGCFHYSYNCTNSRLIQCFVIQHFNLTLVNHGEFCYFLQSFTCIVGPNGSGKSNVIDAMLFVFGFRANKIRSKKLSVLIHNSERHQNITSCTVKVHFQRIIDTGVSRSRISVYPNVRLLYVGLLRFWLVSPQVFVFLD